MIIVVQPGKEVDHRNIAGVERGMVAGAEAVGGFRYLQLVNRAEGIDQAVPARGSAGAGDVDLVLIDPPDHIHVDHQDGVFQRDRGIFAIMGGAEQSDLFPAETGEDHRAGQGGFGDIGSDAHHRGGAGGVVVGAVMDHRLVTTVAGAAQVAPAEVIIVGTHHNILILEAVDRARYITHHVIGRFLDEIQAGD